MKMTELVISRAVEEGMQLPYAYVRSLSAVTLGNVQPLPPVEEILEARFFSREKEIRLTDDGNGLYALEITDGENPAYIDWVCRPMAGFGKRIEKRCYLRYDEDGQASIVCTRLLDWEE